MVEGLEHMMCSEKLVIHLFSLKRRLEGIQLLCSSIRRDVVEKMESDYSQRWDYSQKVVETIITGWKKENSKWMEGKDSPPSECLSSGTSCPERMRNLHPWGFSKHAWINSWGAWSQSCMEQGLDWRCLEFHSILHPSMILCIHCWILATSTFARHNTAHPLKTRPGGLRKHLCLKQGTRWEDETVWEKSNCTHLFTFQWLFCDLISIQRSSYRQTHIIFYWLKGIWFCAITLSYWL